MYDFKKWPELAWAVGVAAATFVLQVLISTEFSAVSDWKAWLIALGAGAARAAVAVLLAKFSSPSTDG